MDMRDHPQYPDVPSSEEAPRVDRPSDRRAYQPPALEQLGSIELKTGSEFDWRPDFS
jgi:hypothetical protein